MDAKSADTLCAPSNKKGRLDAAETSEMLCKFPRGNVPKPLINVTTAIGESGPRYKTVIKLSVTESCGERYGMAALSTGYVTL